MAIFLTEQDVRTLLTMQDALEAVEEGFRHWAQGQATNDPRRRIRVAGGYLQFMSAADHALNLTGFKAYTTGRAGGFLVNIYRADTGELLAILQAGWLGAVRTGAASGVATKYMARPDASLVGCIGAGYQARTQIEAVCAVRPIREVRVFSRTPEKRQAFAQEMAQHLGIPVYAVDSAKACVEGAHIVITITNSREPVFNGEWLSPGTHINAAGSNSWMRRELDEVAIRRANLIVADQVEDARIECGELIWAVERGVVRWDQVRDLRDVVGGMLPGRVNPDHITLFESQGLALEDIVTAWRVYQKARERGIGLELPSFPR
ncbi:Delta(1)-pyrroline-2-carboxylate reductase [bacterium HR23]|nr:Delta(1)-pyrroline-2-carboxylate reductase [bacterium HR23]